MKKWFLILMILALPVAGLASQENEVVELPTVAPLQIATPAPAADDSVGTVTWEDWTFGEEAPQTEAPAASPYSSESLREYYASLEADGIVYQLPRMTTEEQERAETLLKEYEAGTRPKENVLNKMENVVVGVYPLNPVDYEGETMFTLLPYHPLTDEEILEVIDAFAQSGQTFDPGVLTYKNCMRGGGIEATRFYQTDERERRAAVRSLYIRQGFTSETAYTPLVSDDGLGKVTLETDAYSGLDNFLFLPYRQMTDDELLGYVMYSEVGNPAEYSHYAAYEKQLRLELRRVLHAPWVMALEFENTNVINEADVSYDVYYSNFYTPAGVTYSGYLDMDTSEVLEAWLHLHETLLYSDLHLDPFDEKWLTIAKETVQTLRTDGMEIADAQSMGEDRLNQGGYGVIVNVYMEDGGYYQMTIAYQNEKPNNVIYYQSHVPDVEWFYGTGQQE